MSKAKKGSSKTILRTGEGIGFAAAEDDWYFLQNCFVSSPQHKNAVSMENPGSVLLGRTGSGKSAILSYIESTQENVIRINPENLALQYISNSSIISFFSGIGVELDLFFQLLWRHVISVELINYRYKVMNRTDSERVVEVLKGLLGKDTAKRLALDYLERWGSKFWEESHSRVVELVGRFEEQLKAGTGIGAFGSSVNIEASDLMSQEQKTQIVNDARKVVSEIQLQHLSVLMNSLNDEILSDKSKKYYILIDDLDLFTVSQDIRYRLIRALVETIKSFKKVLNVKILIAMRIDLIEQVYKVTRSAGFQEEKYEGLNVKVEWTEAQLFELVESRISFLFKSKYTKDNVKFADIFAPEYRQSGSTFSHLAQRTQFRPRDIIAFINIILERAAGKTQITANDIDEAETEYSRKRIAALASEWTIEHPHLEDLCCLVRGYPARFAVGEITKVSLEELAMTLVGKAASPDGIVAAAEDFLEDKISDQNFRKRIFSILYKVGIVGLKPTQVDPTYFAYSGAFSPPLLSVDDTFRASISPMAWRALGVYRSRKVGEIVE